MKIKILYEDSNILVIDKPSGISVHPAAEQTGSESSKPVKVKQEFITDWVVKNYPKMKNVGEPAGEIQRPGIVHRLDRETSGAMLLAKNQKAFEFLKNQFVNREIKKVYHTIVSGSVRNDRGIINKPIGRSPRDFRRYLAGRGARGEMREAITEYKVLKRFEISHNKFTYLEVKPKTGRTHQIRVHMKYLNHPVVCDSLYNAPKSGQTDQSCPKGITRMALHAREIEFKDLKGKTVKIESPLPKEFQNNK